ncbi:hypothetical protein O1611_g3360 [Lasiodiplodia mahajangana]|uniref:Uncharacterized protein n=1 Tax=Lasiodiplodia mahajangana TaxID=1108764 RepID=A0ACC2JSE5_9PEZI|nr:hypothetical protein O1611_g3360 [Lasiodiplodia mahajangana]
MSAAFVTRPAPEFTATTVFPGGEFKDISLSEYLGQWVVLLFYPLDFTFVCPTEIIQYNEALPRFKAINTTVLGVSTDSHFSHLAWVERPRKQGGLGPDLQLPLVSDKSHKISRSYGVLLEEEGVALRGLFIIDPKGVLRQITVNDLPVGRDVEETLRLVQAFQFTDEHGEVCPAGWHTGSKTMKADPKGSLEYFAAQNGETNGHANGNGKRARVDHGHTFSMLKQHVASLRYMLRLEPSVVRSLGRYSHSMASLRRPHEPLVAIIGTTGTGKSDLAVDLAVRFGGEIINADAMQMYRGLPVITNQISVEEQRGIPHHLLAQIDPLEPTWTNGLFVRETQRLIQEIRSRGKLPIVVGGTLYYVQALLFEGSLIDAEETEPDKIRFRSQEETLSQFPILNDSTDAILQKLREVDPAMAERWHPDDRRKITRSLEIYLTTGKRASDIYAEARQAANESRRPWETLVFWTHAETDALRDRLSKRVDKMVQNGLMDEVRLLHSRLRECTERGEVIDRTRGIWQSIGFKQMEAFLDAEFNMETLESLEKRKNTGLEEINIATRQYARYQLRWIRQRTLKSFKEHNAMGLLYLLDSTNANEFSTNVLRPAADVCRQYLAGEKRPQPTEISDVAAEILTTLERESPSGQTTFKVKKCEMCDMILPTEDSWVKHINGRKHRRIAKMKKYTALVPVEVETPDVEKTDHRQ